MREGSLPPFGLGFSPRELARRTLARLTAKLHRTSRRKPRLRGRRRIEEDAGLSERAAEVIREHEAANVALFERMTRLEGKVERLREAGTPSESTENRAARARGEVAEELAALRATFVADAGERGGEAFDRQVRVLYPSLKHSADDS